mgnify:CR=1 FL=1
MSVDALEVDASNNRISKRIRKPNNRIEPADLLYGESMEAALAEISDDSSPVHTSPDVPKDSQPKKSKSSYSKRKLANGEKQSNEQPEKKKRKVSHTVYPSSASSSHLASHGKPWTEEEGKLFVKALDLFGNGKWVQIAEYVATRNALQVKNHARNYFKRLRSEGKPIPSRVGESTEKTMKLRKSPRTLRTRSVSCSRIDNRISDDNQTIVFPSPSSQEVDTKGLRVCDNFEPYHSLYLLYSR